MSVDTSLLIMPGQFEAVTYGVLYKRVPPTGRYWRVMFWGSDYSDGGAVHGWNRIVEMDFRDPYGNTLTPSSVIASPSGATVTTVTDNNTSTNHYFGSPLLLPGDERALAGAFFDVDFGSQVRVAEIDIQNADTGTYPLALKTSPNAVAVFKTNDSANLISNYLSGGSVWRAWDPVWLELGPGNGPLVWTSQETKTFTWSPSKSNWRFWRTRVSTDDHAGGGHEGNVGYLLLSAGLASAALDGVTRSTRGWNGEDHQPMLTMDLDQTEFWRNGGLGLDESGWTEELCYHMILATYDLTFPTTLYYGQPSTSNSALRDDQPQVYDIDYSTDLVTWTDYAYVTDSDPWSTASSTGESRSYTIP